jgi:hypothetical protein
VAKTERKRQTRVVAGRPEDDNEVDQSSEYKSSADESEDEDKSEDKSEVARTTPRKVSDPWTDRCRT